MSYWSLLEESRRRLTAGDFLEAERLYFQARDEHGKSRLRAPLMEKGVEPLVRGVRRLLRKPAGEEGPAFPRAAERLLKDLKEVATLHENDARRRAAKDPAEIDLDGIAHLALALRLQRQSRLFRLEANEHWQVTRAYLQGCVRHGAVVKPDELDPELVPPEGESVWLCRFLLEHPGAIEGSLGPAAPWLLKRLAPLAAVEGGEWQGEALALRSRLYLQLPGGAPHALREGIFALEAVYPPHEVAPLLRQVAGLAVNESRLVTCGADLTTLDRLATPARRFGLRWPPPRLVELLQARRPSEGMTLAALSWEGDVGQPLVVVRTVDGHPVDVLALRPVEEADGGDDPFALPMTEARALLQAWLPEQTPVLCGPQPPGWLRSLLGERPVLALQPLGTALPLADAPGVLPEPAAPHPLFAEDSDDPLAAPWLPLVQRARSVGPRLASLAEVPALASPWGLQNLEKLGSVGLSIPRSLAIALEAMGVGTEGEIAVTEVDGVVPLAWPQLSERAWPGHEQPVIPIEGFSGDVLISGRPSPAELAGCALAAAPCVLITRDDRAAKEMAGGLVGHVDPRRVTAAPRRVVCPEGVFSLLDDWIEESVTDERRSLDVLWLYHLLAITPDGDLSRWLDQGDRPEARAAVETVLQSADACTGACRLKEVQGCWPDQLELRRRAGEVWVEWADLLEGSSPAIDPLRTLVCDDLVELIAEVEDDRALARMDGLMDRAAVATSLVAWMDAALVAEALVREWSGRLPEGRVFSLLSAAEGPPPPALHLALPGYAPGCSLFEEESRALIQARAQAWIRRERPARAWVAPGAATGVWKDLAGPHPLQGVGKGAHEAVVVALLGRPGPLDPVLALMRLAAAARHATGEVACVDPRLSELFGGAWAVAPSVSILPDPAPATGSAELLDRLSPRAAPRWRQPFAAGRLDEVARRLGAGRAPQEPRRKRLAEVLAPLGRHGRRVVGSMLREDRLLAAWTMALLAEESRDGGPLDARFVVWIGDGEADLVEGAPFGVMVAGREEGAQGAELAAALEEGRVRLLVVPPTLLRLRDWRRWLAGLRHCAFVLAEGDRLSPEHPAHQSQIARVLEEVFGTDSDPALTLLACFDQAETSLRASLSRLAERLKATVGLVEPGSELEQWRWQRIRLEDPEWYCARCHREQTLPHPHALCVRCGQALLQTPAERAAAAQVLRSSRVRWLSRQGFEKQWIAVTPGPDQRDALLHDLGIVSRQEAAPLLGDSWSLNILTLAQLWEADPPAGEVVFTWLPEDPRHLRAAMARLRSRGRLHGVLHFMDHPLAWTRDDPSLPAASTLPPLSTLRWTASRAEVEFRCREALGRVERALRARGRVGRGRRGLGPVADPREDPRVASLAEAVALWREAARDGFPEEKVQQQGLKECLRVFERLAEGGLGFDEGSGRLTMSLPELFTQDAQRDAALAVLRWLVAEGLMEGEGDEPRPEIVEAPSLSEAERCRWLDSARTAPTGVATELSPWPSVAPSAVKTDEEVSLPPIEGNWVRGVAGSGKTQRLMRAAGEGVREGPTPLVIVANAMGVLRWEEAVASPVYCVTLDELILDFLRCHHDLGGFTRPPRILAPSFSPEGEDLRRRLLKETSRRYAVAAGMSPPVDLMEMRRVVEGTGDTALSAVAGAEVDAGLLRQCAAEARRADNWVLPSELGVLSRRWLIEHPYVGEAWRDRYPVVLVDDVDAMPPEKREFLDRLFPEAFRTSSADPALLPAGHPLRGDGGTRQSRRMPRELTRAGEYLLREEILGRGSIKPRSREKGKLLRHQVLNLQACVRQIEGALSGQQWQRQRVGVIVAYGGDLPRLASHLRDAEIQVWPSSQVLPACLAGPRDFLLALALGGKGSELETEVCGSLALALLRIAGIDVAHHEREDLGRWVQRCLAQEAPRPSDPAEAFLEPLGTLAPHLQRVESVLEAARAIEATHLMPRVETDEIVAARLAHHVQQRSEMPWRGVLVGLDPAVLVDPLAPGPRVWLLEMEDLASVELDRAFYLCTGHEPAELHYRVLGRVRESLTVLYSERDPFSARG